MNFIFFSTILLLFFCNPLLKNSDYVKEIKLDFLSQWQLFLWEKYYNKQWENLSNEIATLIINKLSLEKKIGQIIHTGISGTKINNELIEQVKKYSPGGFILFKTNIENQEKLITLVKDIQNVSIQNSSLPVFFSIDQEGGRIVRIENFVSEFPGAMALGQTENPFFAWLNGFIVGFELSQIGIHLIFAPVADINNNPLNPVINTRSFGSSVDLVSDMVSAYIQGMNLTPAIHFLKHFPGHGDTNIDSHYDLPVIHKTIDEIKQYELIPFVRGIQNDATGVMIAHLYFPKIDENPSSLSRYLITNLLKKELQFKGLIITDAMEMKAVADRYSIEESAKKSFLAGTDIILLTTQSDNLKKVYESFQEAIEKKEITEERLNESVKKQIQFKLKAGVFDKNLLIKVYKIDPNLVERFLKLWEIKKEISNSIYKNIKFHFGEYEEEIAYHSIRSLYKDFPALTEEEKKNVILVYYNSLYRDFFPYKNVYNKEEFYSKMKQDLNKNCVLLYELNDSKELEKMKKKICPKIIYLYEGNPFQKFQLGENEYIIASFSPARISKKAMIKKILNDSISKSNLILVQ